MLCSFEPSPQEESFWSFVLLGPKVEEHFLVAGGPHLDRSCGKFRPSCNLKFLVGGLGLGCRVFWRSCIFLCVDSGANSTRIRHCPRASHRHGQVQGPRKPAEGLGVLGLRGFRGASIIRTGILLRAESFDSGSSGGLED